MVEERQKERHNMLIFTLFVLAMAWVFIKVAPALIITLLIVTGAVVILKEIKDIIKEKKNK